MEQIPTAVVWYGAMASNHTLLSSVVVRRIRGASPGETTWKMTGTAAGMTTSRGAWSSEKEKGPCASAGGAPNTDTMREVQSRMAG